MSNLSAEIQSLLSLNLSPTVILTIGNSLRGDDGVGPYIASKLSSSDVLLIINAECNPENSIDKITAFKPKSIIVIDAADFRGEPGQIELIDKAHIPETTVSTHLIPLKVIAEILYEDTKAEIKFLGIQPKNVNLGTKICEEVKTSADNIIAQIKKGV